MAASAAGGLGGPYVPADASPDAAIGRAAQLLDKLDTLRRRLATLPLRRPLAGDLTITSGFGARQDPFLGAPALHTGVDFRAADGTPVLATAPGTIEATGRQGGYGLAIDIDHGGGISTRYGHLSRIAVSVGQHVMTGDTIGYAGSTGRSTGPHLHYETRVAGEAVDPTDWLQAGERLTAFLD
jgi:murein DD-endopeptidase MepM/ murein hydrolase activator NlpD